MNSSESIKALLEDRFKFLNDQDFNISTFDFYKDSFGDWKIIFQSKTCLIQIYSDRGNVDIIFIPMDANIDKRFGLSTLVYFISNGERFIGSYEGDLSNKQDQIERLAKILKEYFNEIMVIMETDISRYYAGLEEAGNAVLKMVYEEFRKKRYKPL